MNRKKSKRQESYFNGYCWLAAIRRADRQIASALIGRWPTVGRIMQVVEEEGLRYSDELLTSILVPLKGSDSTFGYHVVPGNVPAHVLFQSMNSNTVVGGEQVLGTSEVLTLLTYCSTMVAVMVYSLYVLAPKATAVGQQHYRRLQPLARKGSKSRLCPPELKEMEPEPPVYMLMTLARQCCPRKTTTRPACGTRSHLGNRMRN